MTNLDPEEQILTDALEKIRKRVESADHPTSKDIDELVSARKRLDDYRKRALAANGVSFANQTEALAYLQQRFKIQKSKLSKDVRDGICARRDGVFYAKDLDKYAAVADLQPINTPDPGNGETAKDDLVREQVRKIRQENDIREGLYVLRSTMEQDFAARAAFLKNDLANFGPRVIDRMVHHMASLLRDSGVELPDDINLQAFIPDLEDYYDVELDSYLHDYATRKIASVTL